MYFHSFSLVWTVQLFVYRSIMSLFMYHQPTVLLFIYWPFVQYFIYRGFVLVPRVGFHRNSSHAEFLPRDSSHGIPPTGIPLTQDSSHTGFLPNPVWAESYGRNPVCEESCGRNSMTTMYRPNWPHYTKFLDTCAHFHYSLNYWYMSPFLDLSPEL